uniref:protein salvador homolog 1-like n=1 Tax=Myxine glutinosa TaxID=7769 RepID=UPI00358F82F4
MESKEHFNFDLSFKLMLPLRDFKDVDLSTSASPLRIPCTHSGNEAEFLPPGYRDPGLEWQAACRAVSDGCVSHRFVFPHIAASESEAQTECIKSSEASLPSGWLVQWPLGPKSHRDEDCQVNGTCSWNHPVGFSRSTDSSWRHSVDPRNGAYYVDHITCHSPHQQQRPQSLAQIEERSHVVEQKRSILVPANPYRCADMPEWLRMYARAPTKYDHILKWSLFQMTALDTYQAMLKMLFMKELELVVRRYEVYRQAVLMELRQRSRRGEPASLPGSGWRHRMALAPL